MLANPPLGFIPSCFSHSGCWHAASLRVLSRELSGGEIWVVGYPMVPPFLGPYMNISPTYYEASNCKSFPFFLIKNSVTFFNISINNLVGGFKHEFYFPFHIWDVILPIDEVHHFKDG